MSRPRLVPLVRSVEARLSRYYGFAPVAGAAEHLVSRGELLQSLGDGAKELPEWQARAAVWLVDAKDPEDDVFIGLHFGDEIAERLTECDPSRGLSDENLDAYCTLVEEVSHFHLILNRVRVGRQLTKLELEWQGEIDKLLICALTLQEQAGDPHLLPLARRLFDDAAITAEDWGRYWEATRYAARFWYDALRDSPLLSDSLRTRLIRAYHASWSDKVADLGSAA